MKVLYACDLHGRRHLYQEMLALAVRSDVDCIILGGDLFPTLIPSPFALINGKADFQDDLKGQLDFVKAYLVPSFASFLSSNQGIRLVYIPGNHDWMPAIERLQENLPQAVCIHGKAVHLDGITLFGYACVTDSTFWVKDYVRRDRSTDSYVNSKFAIVSDIDHLRFSANGEYALRNPSIEEELSGISFDEPAKAICVFHCPPFDTGLDTLHNGKPIGSRAVREFLERMQPMVSLHGHIHESPYMSGIFQTRIKNCLAANPGYGPRNFHALVFDTNDPSGTLTHSLFGKEMPPEGLSECMPVRRMRKIKAFFMDTVLRGK